MDCRAKLTSLGLAERMPPRLSALLLVALLGLGAPALVSAAVEVEDGSAPEAPYLQCVPYARQVSGIRIYGDAHTWWDQAEGRYARGRTPRVGAVIAFRPNGNMRLGHVAAVSRIVDSRTLLLRHANWSPINGRRGRIEDHVRAVDVSPANDWSEVRVWFAPIQDLGSTHWPVRGFIYNRAPGDIPALPDATQLARRESTARNAMTLARTSARTSVSTTGLPVDDPIGAIIARKTRLAVAR